MASGNRNPSSTSTSTAKVNGNGNDVGGLVGSNLNEAEIDSYIKPDEPVIVVEKAGSANEPPVPLSLRDRAKACKTYDFTATGAAPHISGVNAIDVPSNARWLFTGADDGYVRVYDYIASMKGEKSLTIAEKYGYPDTVTKSGIIYSVWPIYEHKKESNGSFVPANSSLVPIYSLSVQSDAVWALTGLKTGSINLYTARHDEGSCQYVFTGHKGPVSCTKLLPDEKSFVSGSWDKNIIQWDLNTGKAVRSYTNAHNYYIASLSWQPEATSPLLCSVSCEGVMAIWDPRQESAVQRYSPSGVKPWARSACWSPDGRHVYVGRRKGKSKAELPSVDEFDILEQRNTRNIKFPEMSGAVSAVAAMPNGKHLVCACSDSVRLYNLREENETGDNIALSSESIRKRKLSETGMEVDNSGTKQGGQDAVPFVILQSKSRSLISDIYIDPDCRFMITSSGARGFDDLSRGIPGSDNIGSPTNECIFYEISCL